MSTIKFPFCFYCFAGRTLNRAFNSSKVVQLYTVTVLTDCPHVSNSGGQEDSLYFSLFVSAIYGSMNRISDNEFSVLLFFPGNFLYRVLVEAGQRTSKPSV